MVTLPGRGALISKRIFHRHILIKTALAAAGLFAGQAAQADPPIFPQFHSPNRGGELRFSVGLGDRTPDGKIPFGLTLDVTGPKGSAAFDVLDLASTIRHGRFRELGSQALKLGRMYVPKSVLIPVAGAVVVRNSARDGNLYRNIADLASQQAFQKLGCVSGKTYSDQVSCNNAVDLTYALMGLQNIRLTDMPALRHGEDAAPDKKTALPCDGRYSVMLTKCTHDLMAAMAPIDPFTLHIRTNFSRPSAKHVPAAALAAIAH